MNSNLTVTKLSKNDIDPSLFFADFMQKAAQENLIEQPLIHQIQQQLLFLLHREADSFSFGDSSLPLDDAQVLMESIEYTLGIRLKEEPSIEYMILLLQDKKLLDIFKEGQMVIQEQLRTIRKIKRLLQKTKLTTSNLTYNEVIDKAIPVFLQKYRYDEMANDHILTLDYPVYMFNKKMIGVDAIKQYATQLLYENMFLTIYDAKNLEMMFQQNIPIFQEQIISLYQFSLTHFLLSHLINHDDIQTTFSQSEVAMITWEIEHLQTDEQLLQKFMQILNSSTIFLSLNKKVRNYVHHSLPIISEEILSHYHSKHLEQILFLKKTF